jgi:hypothetical protein
VNGGMDYSDGMFMNRVIDGLKAGKLLSDKSIGRLLAIHHKHARTPRALTPAIRLAIVRE